jgi:hypothetical protein
LSSTPVAHRSLFEATQLNRLPSFSDAQVALLAPRVGNLALLLDSVTKHGRNNCPYFDRDDSLALLTAFHALVDSI